MPQCIAFHSYKGGTGKTTIAANVAAALALKGHSVALIDLDVYAPSLHTYFNKTPTLWLNDLFLYNARSSDVMVDMTSVIDRYAAGSKHGQLWAGFSNPQREEIYKLENTDKETNLKLLRRFVRLREDLISNYKSDYIIIDTSPGIRYWSINALAIADTLLLTLKFDDFDIEGTKKMAKDIYSSFTKFGAKSHLLLNRVAGYCVPHTIMLKNQPHEDSNQSSQTSDRSEVPQAEEDFGTSLSRETSIDMISAIPCYCDIQFARKEYMTVLQYPEHPFAIQMDKLAESLLMYG
jgi:chromosome partitioning protein